MCVIVTTIQRKSIIIMLTIVTTIQFTPTFHYPPERLFLVDLCNGFTCFVNGPTHIEKHSVYISNPLLGEYFEVKLPEWEISVSRVTYGFFFSKASEKYKVLRFVVRKLTKVSELEVYTFGVCEKLRNVGEIVNGALHWMVSEKNAIIFSFDIETEKVKSLPAPSGLVNPPCNLKLVELGNYLCLTDYYKALTTNIDIWWMKEYRVSESWTKKSFWLILKLASYNPKMKSFRVVYVYGKVITAITYTPSFYSLKTIMGDDFHLTNMVWALLELKTEYNYYVCRCNRPIQLTTNFHYPLRRVFLVGLCNGLTFFANDPTHIENHSIYISNPLLGDVCHATYGFCFSKAFGKYKVLRLVLREITKLSELEVYTLGVGEKWRNVGKIPCPVWYNFGKVNINGSIHWMDSEKMTSFTPSILRQKSEVPANSTGTGKSNLELEASRWMKEYGISESWTKDIILVDFIPHGMKDGEILIQSGRKLASYNPKIKSFRMIYVYGIHSKLLLAHDYHGGRLSSHKCLSEDSDSLE
ncbi:hypothetical protein R3W88_014615 [Solanum pinnatisectum]|uniref:F-box associated beta-propeller type 3 domain-containing protein n=1 Tax=Solanum pinnatisectum TaxID=50273 RepID=A0AAV9KWJ7_9SOLN|nr:hypothetical protein R3W88_014615 [Solanum pinnatisectum]